MRLLRILFALAAISISATGLGAWSNHFLFNHRALAVMPELAKAEKFPVETLEDFLLKEQTGLVAAMGQMESQVAGTLAKNAPLPEALVFRGGDRKSIRRNFLRAIRINPDSPLGYYLQSLPGETPAKRESTADSVSIFGDKSIKGVYRYHDVKPRDTVSALEVLATASDEPDFGHDIYLFVDNGKDFGKEYGFGNQSFGDPKVYYTSQAPFHIGYYHESKIIFLAGSFLTRTYPPYRIHQFTSLARYAFKTGHPYWGYRFLGWGLHYLGDLSQPYHTRVLANYGTLSMLWINIKAMLGFESDKNAAIERVSNRHATIENYHLAVLARAYSTHNPDHNFLRSLVATSHDADYRNYSEAYAIDVVARESYDLSDKLDTLIDQAKLLTGFSDGNLKPDLNPKAIAELDEVLARLMQGTGSHARNYVRAGLK